MKYLSADLLPKVFHGLMCIMYLSYTYNSYSQPEQAVPIFGMVLDQLPTKDQWWTNGRPKIS